jgi:N-acetylmuramate 1-kinase
MTNMLPQEAAEMLDRWLGAGWVAEALAGDASVRAYYRVRRPDGTTAMLAYYPAEVRPQLARFLSTYRAISPNATLPAVLESCDFAVLQEDAGDRTIFDVLQSNREEGLTLYQSAVDLLVALQRTEDPRANEAFTAEFFEAELEMAADFFSSRLMGLELDGESKKAINKVCRSVASHPYVLCHRDYHGQNLHVQNGLLYLIDYQDARLGPDTYDLASLLRDRGVGRIIGADRELELLDRWANASGAVGDFRRRYFETLLQRSVKIFGTFAKIPIVRGRMHYLDFIPPAMETVSRCLEELPEYAALAPAFVVPFDRDAAIARATDLYAAGTQ